MAAVVLRRAGTCWRVHWRTREREAADERDMMARDERRMVVLPTQLVFCDEVDELWRSSFFGME